jgi:hypothetical protein
MGRLGVTTTRRALPAVASTTLPIFAQWSRQETHEVVQFALGVAIV